MTEVDARRRAFLGLGTRRDFLKRVGEAGGFAAAFSTMNALGLLFVPAAKGEDLKLPPDAGKGVKVAILGGGIAGLVSAFELRKAGYSCTVLEARPRPGGRNWTVRGGTKVDFRDGTSQTARWGPGNYLNPGPARLPSIHKTMLGYCQELGVALEVEVNTSRSSLLQNDKAFGGKPIEQRQAINDTRGLVAELLAKCINQRALDEQFTAEDHNRMLEFLRIYGDLKPDYSYKGTARAGMARYRGAGPVSEELRAPLEMHALLDARFWGAMLFEEMIEMQATMFQPIGGMDRIPFAFAKKLGPIVRYGCEIREIRKTSTGVNIIYSRKGATKALQADYCICTLPVTILKSIPNDFSPRIQQAIKDTAYDDAYKIGWESKRFWETDCNIYGGISWAMTGPVNMVWYPTAKLFSETGVLIAGYGVENGSEFAKLARVEEKLKASRAAVERLHPGYSDQLGQPIYVNWGEVPHNLGSWVRARRFDQGVEQESGYYQGPYLEFIQPDDRIFFAGDHCSQVGAWQEGAALAAHRAIRMLTDRVRQTT